MSKNIVVIPSFNELSSLKKIVKHKSSKYKFIVIDDGSYDKTKVIAERNNVYVLSHYKNLGYDKAITSGFIEAIKFNNEKLIDTKDLFICFIESGKEIFSKKLIMFLLILSSSIFHDPIKFT